MSNLDEKKATTSETRPFYLTGWGIVIFSYLSCGVALPFLLWARGPKTKVRRKKIVISTLVVCLTVLPLLIAGAIVGEPVESVPAPNLKSALMPKVIGLSLESASEQLNQLAVEVQIKEQDLISSRSVWDTSNWTVVGQSPPSGEKLVKDQLVCIGIVKIDEAWQTPNRLQCWESANDELQALGDNYKFINKDLIKLTNLPASLEGKQLKAKVEIELDRGDTLYLPFCTYASVANFSTNLKLDASNGGDPGLFADGGQSFEAGLFLDWNGSYRYSITKLEKSDSSKCTG